MFTRRLSLKQATISAQSTRTRMHSLVYVLRINTYVYTQVIIATGNDWRAIEAGAHAYAARSGQYRPLGKWKVVGNALHGSIELPMQVFYMRS